MRYLSVCSGIEAATVAWHPLGWQAAGFSEIEPFPSAVLAHHYPSVTNYGDMTKYQEWNLDSVDLLVGGTPCQSFSVAGLRKGLADPRGNLMLTYGAMAKHFRAKWLVWENVPGVLSSNGGRDFGTFLGMLAELGYGFAYRVLDAQWFGVAQRRRRVFVVGCLGDWRRAATVLFERESLRGNPAPSREAWQNPSKTLTRGVSQRYDFETEDLIPTYSLQGNLIGRDAGGPQGVGVSGDGVMYTLTKADVHGVAQPVTYDLYNVTAPVNGQNRTPGDPCHTLARANAQHAAWVHPNMAVRRLTPVECERLQGFPDGYTDIQLGGKQTPDGPRYKALGNSMAVPVMRWIGERIKEVQYDRH